MKVCDGRNNDSILSGTQSSSLRICKIDLNIALSHGIVR